MLGEDRENFQGGRWLRPKLVPFPPKKDEDSKLITDFVKNVQQRNICIYLVI